MLFKTFDVCFARVRVEEKGQQLFYERPIVVVQDESENTIKCLKCTSNVNTPVKHYNIFNLTDAGLSKPTAIVLKNFIRLDKSSIISKVGHLNIYDSVQLQVLLDSYKEQFGLQEHKYNNK